MKKNKVKRKEKEEEEETEGGIVSVEMRERGVSIYDLWRSSGRISSGQDLKFIYSTRATRGYKKHEISLRIRAKSLGNQRFRV